MIIAEPVVVLVVVNSTTDNKKSICRGVAALTLALSHFTSNIHISIRSFSSSMTMMSTTNNIIVI